MRPKRMRKLLWLMGLSLLAADAGGRMPGMLRKVQAEETNREISSEVSEEKLTEEQPEAAKEMQPEDIPAEEQPEAAVEMTEKAEPEPAAEEAEPEPAAETAEESAPEPAAEETAEEGAPEPAAEEAAAEEEGAAEEMQPEDIPAEEQPEAAVEAAEEAAPEPAAEETAEEGAPEPAAEEAAEEEGAAEEMPQEESPAEEEAAEEDQPEESVETAEEAAPEPAAKEAAEEAEEAAQEPVAEEAAEEAEEAEPEPAAEETAEEAVEMPPEEIPAEEPPEAAVEMTEKAEPEPAAEEAEEAAPEPVAEEAAKEAEETEPEPAAEEEPAAEVSAEKAATGEVPSEEMPPEEIPTEEIHTDKQPETAMEKTKEAAPEEIIMEEIRAKELPKKNVRTQEEETSLEMIQKNETDTETNPEETAEPSIPAGGGETAEEPGLVSNEETVLGKTEGYAGRTDPAEETENTEKNSDPILQIHVDEKDSKPPEGSALDGQEGEKKEPVYSKADPQETGNMDLQVRFKIETAHISEETLSVTARREDLPDEDLKVSMQQEINTGNIECILENIPNDRSGDGIYQITATALDKSGRTVLAHEEIRVNRYGSRYSFSDGREDCLAESSGKERIICERNLDKVTDAVVMCSRDGETMQMCSGDQLLISEAMGQDGWYEYLYRLPDELFTEEGIYEVQICSKDTAGNSCSLGGAGETMKIIVDRTAPELMVTGIETGRVYHADELWACLDIRDQSPLQQIRVFRNGVLEGCCPGDIVKDGLFKWKLDQDDKWQTLQFSVTDASGNTSVSEPAAVYVDGEQSAI